MCQITANDDILYMRRCIQLAKNGFPDAMPNPMVGAVIVAHHRIIGEGWHRCYGGPHAEVNAFASVRPQDEPLLNEATIYVSLEPCAHYGKTPPCAQLLIKKGIKRCVVGCIDPFAKVQGKGIEMLKKAGIDVTVGMLEKECRQLNKAFMTFHQQQRPFITLKWAQTADGYIGYDGQTADTPLHISNPLTQTLGHKRRAAHQTILVGRRTMEVDHPTLNVRHWANRGGKDDPRIIVLSTSHYPNLAMLVEKLYAEGVQTLLVEGGRATLQSFIDEGWWDEAFVETSPQTLTELLQGNKATGIAAPMLHHAALVDNEGYGGHQLQTFIHKP